MITGKLSLGKDKIVYITSSDKVVPGGGDDPLKTTVPVRKVPVDINDYNSNGPTLKELRRYPELRRQAAAGATITTSSVVMVIVKPSSFSVYDPSLPVIVTISPDFISFA